MQLMNEELLTAWYKRNILVTGVAGFLGYHLKKLLTDFGANVTGVDNYVSKHCEYGTRNAIISNLDDYAIEEILKKRFDVIFHLAGNALAAESVSNPMKDFELNLIITLRFLERLRKSGFEGKIIFASSAAVYGQPMKMPIAENVPVAPINPYGVSKLSSENYLSIYSELYGFRCSIARLFSLYGPRQAKQVVYDLIRKSVMHPEEIVVLGDGSEVRDFLYVNDAALALCYLGQASNNEDVYNVCSGQGISIKSLSVLIVNQLGIPQTRLKYTNERRKGDPLYWIGDNTKLKKTGFTPNVDIKAGIEKTCKWSFSCMS